VGADGVLTDVLVGAKVDGRLITPHLGKTFPERAVSATRDPQELVRVEQQRVV
jgi:hypothetical protein